MYASVQTRLISSLQNLKWTTGTTHYKVEPVVRVAPNKFASRSIVFRSFDLSVTSTEIKITSITTHHNTTLEL